MFKQLSSLAKSLINIRADMQRNKAIKNIREFDEVYRKGGEILASEFDYTILTEDELAQKSPEELKDIVERCETGRKYAVSARNELQIRLDAENKNYLFKARYIAPRNSMCLEFSKYSHDLEEKDRHCLVLLRIFQYYNYMTESEFTGAAVAFLGYPKTVYADESRSSRNFDSAAEILDRPFIDMILSARVTPKSDGYKAAQNKMDSLIRERPNSVRLQRIRKEFQAKGVLAQ